MDFAAWREKASADAAPHIREAEAQREKALNMREQTKACRKVDKARLADKLMPEIEAADKAIREATAKAQTIEDAVYDLKAINSREKKVIDTRTPSELLAAIVETGREVDAALARLGELMAVNAAAGAWKSGQ